jgi:hypothetical protein
LIYFLVVGPSSIMARLFEEDQVGFVAPEPLMGTAMERAALQG